MSEDSCEADAEIIAAAYAERVREAFRAFADNVGMGQNEKTSADRFVRSLALIKRARDIAIAAVRAEAAAAAAAPPAGADAETAGADAASAADGLSAEVRAMIENAVGQTQGSRKLG